MAVGRINSVQSAGRMGPAPVVGKINAAHVIGALGGLALLAGAAHGASQAYQGYKDQQAFKKDLDVASGKRPNPFVEPSEARKRVGEIQMESMQHDGYPNFENQVNQGLINADTRSRFNDIRGNYQAQMGRRY